MNSVALKWGSKTQSDRGSSKMWTIICDNFETVRDGISVSINHKQEVIYELSISTDIRDFA